MLKCFKPIVCFRLIPRDIALETMQSLLITIMYFVLIRFAEELLIDWFIHSFIHYIVLLWFALIRSVICRHDLVVNISYIHGQGGMHPLSVLFSCMYEPSQQIFTAYYHLFSNIFWNHTNGRVFNKEFCAHRIEKLMFLYLFDILGFPHRSNSN